MEIILKNKNVLVLHVKDGYEIRKRHIDKMLSEMEIPFEYIIDGDIQDLTFDVLNKYFEGKMHRCNSEVSCAYKHLIACKVIIDKGLDGALILEDDICLNRKRFIHIFNQSIKELEEKEDKPSIISYEDTRMRFVPRSRRRPGQVLYAGDRDRMTGACYLNRQAALLLVNYAETHKFDLPYDLTHYRLLKEGKLNYYWCHPVVASQGSHTGKFSSSLNLSKGFYYPLTWQLKLMYKKLLYNMR